MRLRVPLLTLLFLTLTTQTSFAQKKTESSPASASEYGIELTRSYSGSQVLALIQILEKEAEQSIDQAFNEGYKQGMLSAAPDAEYWRVRATQYEAEITRLRKEKWLYAFGGFGFGIILGGSLGITVRVQN